MEYIYCYTNKNNGKKYIGQTNNIPRRQGEHIRCSRAKNLNEASFHSALREEGIESFEFTILFEGDVSQEEIDQKEKDFIRKAREEGEVYNIKNGGYGSRSTELATYSLEVINDVKKLIIKGTPYPEITSLYGCSPAFLSGINHGLYYRDDSQTYPLHRYYFDGDNIYPKMIELLLNPAYRMQDIADELKCSYQTVKKFNVGSLQRGKYWKKEYPIRDRYFVDKVRWEQALELLLTTDIPSRIIGREILHIGDKIMADLNNGRLLKKENIKYPIR